MFFRNLIMFRMSEAVSDALMDDGPEAFAEKPLREPGPLEQSTAGFVSPFGVVEDGVDLVADKLMLIQAGGMERLLPKSVVNEELAARIKKVMDEQGRRVGAKERKRMKDEVLTDFLPRAFVKPSRIAAFIDSERGLLVVDTASDKAAEGLLHLMREAMGTLPATRLAPEESVRAHMTDWVATGGLPAGLALADEVYLVDPSEGGAKVRCSRQDLETDEVREHLKTGKQVVALGLTFQDRISFVLTEDLAVRKFKLLDIVIDELAEDSPETARDEIFCRLVLMGNEVRRLFDALDQVFRLTRPTDR